MSLLVRTADTIYAFRFLRLLTTPWKKMTAYRLGIIDENGKVLKKAKHLETDEERSAYNLFHRLVFNIKRLLNKLPLGKTTIASYIAALWLLKEETGMSDKQLRLVIKETHGIDLMQVICEGTVKPITVANSYTLTASTVSVKGLIIPAGAEIFITERLGKLFGIYVYRGRHAASNSVVIVPATFLQDILKEEVAANSIANAGVDMAPTAGKLKTDVVLKRKELEVTTEEFEKLGKGKLTMKICKVCLSPENYEKVSDAVQADGTIVLRDNGSGLSKVIRTAKVFGTKPLKESAEQDIFNQLKDVTYGSYYKIDQILKSVDGEYVVNDDKSTTFNFVLNGKKFEGKASNPNQALRDIRDILNKLNPSTPVSFGKVLVSVSDTMGRENDYAVEVFGGKKGGNITSDIKKYFFHIEDKALSKVDAFKLKKEVIEKLKKLGFNVVATTQEFNESVEDFKNLLESAYFYKTAPERQCSKIDSLLKNLDGHFTAKDGIFSFAFSVDGKEYCGECDNADTALLSLSKEFVKSGVPMEKLVKLLKVC